MKFILVGLLIATAVITAACSRSEPPSQAPSPSAQTPASTPPAGNMKEIGKSNNLTLEFRKGDQLADPGKVEVNR